MNNHSIAIFGTSRSGKDYTIKETVRILKLQGVDYSHVSMIGSVHSILEGDKLSHMSEPEREKILKKVRNRIDNAALEGNIFVDEHYCFPKTYGGEAIHNSYADEKLPYHDVYDEDLDRTYEVVFKDFYIDGYDAVYYLDIDSKILLNRFRTSEAEKKNEKITINDIRLWKLFEISEIRRLCNLKNIPFKQLIDPSMTSTDIAEDIIRRFES